MPAMQFSSKFNGEAALRRGVRLSACAEGDKLRANVRTNHARRTSKGGVT
jgi:hypothetical protein